MLVLVSRTTCNPRSPTRGADLLDPREQRLYLLSHGIPGVAQSGRFDPDSPCSSSHRRSFSHVAGCGMNFPSSFVHCADSVAFWIAATITAVSCSSGLILVHAFSARPFAAFRGYAFQNVMNEPFRPVRFARTRVCCLLSVSVSDTEFASNVLALGASNVLADSRKPQAINGLRSGL